MNNCTNCPYSEECHDSEKEMTCDEFQDYMQQLELRFFQEEIEKGN